MTTTKISEEAYQKALESLGLIKGENSQKLESENKANQEVELKKAEEEKIAKEAKEKLEVEYKDALQKAEELKAKLEGKELVKAETATTSNSTTITLTNKEENQEFSKALVAEIQKGFDSKISDLAIIIKRKDEEIGELKKAIDAQSEFYAKFGERIGMLEKQPMERKSLDGVKYVERFEKGESGNELEKGIKTLSLNIPSNKKELTDLMWDAFEKGGMKDNELKKGMQSIEMANILGAPDEAQRLQARLLKDFKIKVVK